MDLYFIQMSNFILQSAFIIIYHFCRVFPVKFMISVDFLAFFCVMYIPMLTRVPMLPRADGCPICLPGLFDIENLFYFMRFLVPVPTDSSPVCSI
jgi:hypothetical protein